MLTLLSVALLIQILYYIIDDAHFVIVLFIILSLSLSNFSKNENIYIFIPMLLSHAAYLFLPRPSYEEGFRKRKRKRGFRKIAKKDLMCFEKI